LRSDLGLVARTEVGVTALGGDRDRRVVEPGEQRLAESRAGGDHGDVAARHGLTVGEHPEVAGRELDHAVGRRLEVVQQPHARPAEHARQPALVEGPIEIGHMHDAADHGAGDGQGRRGDRWPAGVGEDARERRLEIRELAVRQHALGGLALAGEIEEPQAGVRTADVAREDHRCHVPCIYSGPGHGL
jgi:hypothetical protein